YWVAAFKQFGRFQDNVAGPGVTITYNYKEAGSFPGDPSWTVRTLTPGDKAQIQDAMTKISQVCDVTFVPDAVAPDVLFAAATAAPGAVGKTFHASGAPTEVWARDIPPSPGDPGTLVEDNSYIYKHEILHALGLDHSTTFFGGADPNLPDDQANGTTLF